MFPASKHRATGGGAPYPGAAAAPRPWARSCSHSKRRNSHRPGLGGGVHPCVWALVAFGTPGWSLLGQGGCRGSPLPVVLPAPAPVPQPASVGGEFLPLSFLAPIGCCHLGSVGRQARRRPWGGRWQSQEGHRLEADEVGEGDGIGCAQQAWGSCGQGRQGRREGGRQVCGG